MPPLQRPERAKSISLSPREAMLAGAADVLVVGGGPAGLGAAVGAASAGADVILAERYGFLGGSATVGLVMPMMSFYNRRARYERATPRQTCAYCRAITAPARPSSAECSRCS